MRVGGCARLPSTGFSPGPKRIHSFLQGRWLGDILPLGPGHLPGWEKKGGGNSDSKHSLYYVFDPEEKLSAGGDWVGWGGATLPGSPPTLATTPFGSQAMPSQPLGAPGLFHRAGRGEGGQEEPLVRAEPAAGLGAGG